MTAPLPAGPWSLTHSGTAFGLLAPAAETVRWDDIATALARLPRWAGHTTEPYSIAQHSVAVSHLVRHYAAGLNDDAANADRVDPAAAALYGLLHDGHEAIIGDITRPVAAALEAIADEVSPGRGRIVRSAIRDLKDRVDCAIFGRAGLTWPMPSAIVRLVERADEVCLATEARDLMPATPWRPRADPLAASIARVWTAEQARAAFLERLSDLGCGRG